MGVDSLVVHAVFGESAVLRLADLAAGWLLTYLLHSAAVILGVWALTSLRRLSDGARDTAWKLALVGGLVTATVQSAIAPSPLSTTFRLPSRATPVAATTLAVPPSGVTPTAGRRVVIARPRGTRWTVALLTFWATASGAALLWLTISHGRTLRDLGEREPLDDTPAGARLRALCECAGIARDVRLTCSDRLTSPVALPGGEICVPRRALVELDATEQESMLAHELAHVVRRDPQWLVAARVVELVLFLQPLNRLVRRRLQEVAEYLSDDWALRRTAHPVSLARCLATVAEWVSHPRGNPSPVPVSAMVEHAGSPLVRRVGRILGERRRSRDRGTAAALAACTGALAALVMVAPRVSIAGAIPPGKALMVVRRVVDTAQFPDGRPSLFRTDSTAIAVRREVVVVERDGKPPMRLYDVGRPPCGDDCGSAVGSGVMRRTSVLVREVSIPGDSIGLGPRPPL